MRTLKELLRKHTETLAPDASEETHPNAVHVVFAKIDPVLPSDERELSSLRDEFVALASGHPMCNFLDGRQYTYRSVGLGVNDGSSQFQDSDDMGLRFAGLGKALGVIDVIIPDFKPGSRESLDMGVIVQAHDSNGATLG